MTRVYRLADVVHEPDTDDPEVLWVAPVPDGPAAKLDGVGPLLFELLMDGPGSAESLVQELRALIPDMPPEAVDAVTAFLESLLGAGILELQEEP